MTKQNYTAPETDRIELRLDDGLLKVFSTKMLLLITDEKYDMTINGPEDW